MHDLNEKDGLKFAESENAEILKVVSNFSLFRICFSRCTANLFCCNRLCLTLKHSFFTLVKNYLPWNSVTYAILLEHLICNFTPPLEISIFPDDLSDSLSKKLKNGSFSETFAIVVI